MRISEKISALREEMKKENIDVYIVPSMDYHQSEYVGEYFKARQFITGFTGSAGTAVFTADESGLWTDGRYFIQAEQQLQGSGIVLHRMGEPDCETIDEFIRRTLPSGGTLGFDGRTFGIRQGIRFEEITAESSSNIRYDIDLVGRIWKDRPCLPSGKAFSLSEKYTGESTSSKLKRVRDKMCESGADLHLISTLDDIAWILNIRGNDIAYCPLVLSHMLISHEKAELFVDAAKFSFELKEQLENDGIVFRPYEEVAAAVSKIAAGSSVLIDPDRLSYALSRCIPSDAVRIEHRNPEILMKSMKNDTETENLKKAHLKDGIAHTKFMYWLKNYDNPEELTEISVSDKLEYFRSLQEGYMGASFAPISAFAEHGAIVHYSATEESDIHLRKGKLLLTDTGGHYPEGSTDITRTVAIGEITEKEKEDFTLVVRAMLHLMNAVFMHGCTGAGLDCLARELFWKERVNFNHGTGHGVGYLMNIHEPPINFRWHESGTPETAFEKGMVITDEPGIYVKNSHGIRIENELLVCEDIKNEYGQFMRFEPLTFVPIDLDALLPDKMTAEERDMLNTYHAEVYRKLESYMDKDEKEWLRRYTAGI